MKYQRQYPCRCRHCGARRTLRQHPGNYLRRRYARCYQCQRDAMRVDWYRKHREHKNRCVCIGMHYPHRPGSTVWCDQHPTGPTEDDYRDRYSSFT